MSQFCNHSRVTETKRGEGGQRVIRRTQNESYSEILSLQDYLSRIEKSREESKEGPTSSISITNKWINWTPFWASVAYFSCRHFCRASLKVRSIFKKISCSTETNFRRNFQEDGLSFSRNVPVNGLKLTLRGQMT